MTGLQADYYVKVLDSVTSEVLAVIDDFKSLEYELLHNDVGNHTIITREDDTRLNDLPLDTYIQVWRKYPGAQNYALDYDGFHRTPQHTITEVNRELNTSYGRSLNDILKRRFLFYKAGSDQTKKSAEVDQVMYEFVEENAGPTAQTSPDRLRNIINSINVVVPDPPSGPIWTGQRSYKNLLEVLQELGTWSTWRFLVTRDYDEEFSADPNALVFRSFEKASERRVGYADPPTLFSPQLGNMLNPSYTKSRTDEFQAVVALGQGEGEDRIFSESVGEGIADSPYNDIEYAEDARQEELTSGLEVAALTVLQDNAPAETFDFEVLQQPSCIYGRDYSLSDYVSARFGNVLLDYRITGVHVIVSEGRENITVTMQHVPHKFNLEPGDLTLGAATSSDPLLDAFKNLSFRLHGLETRESLAGFTLPQFTVPVVNVTGLPVGTPIVWNGTKFVGGSGGIAGHHWYNFMAVAALDTTPQNPTYNFADAYNFGFTEVLGDPSTIGVPTGLPDPQRYLVFRQPFVNIITPLAQPGLFTWVGHWWLVPAGITGYINLGSIADETGDYPAGGGFGLYFAPGVSFDNGLGDTLDFDLLTILQEVGASTGGGGGGGGTGTPTSPMNADDIGVQSIPTGVATNVGFAAPFNTTTDIVQSGANGGIFTVATLGSYIVNVNLGLEGTADPTAEAQLDIYLDGSSEVSFRKFLSPEETTIPATLGPRTLAVGTTIEAYVTQNHGSDMVVTRAEIDIQRVGSGAGETLVPMIYKAFRGSSFVVVPFTETAVPFTLEKEAQGPITKTSDTSLTLNDRGDMHISVTITHSGEVDVYDEYVAILVDGTPQLYSDRSAGNVNNKRVVQLEWDGSLVANQVVSFLYYHERATDLTITGIDVVVKRTGPTDATSPIYT